MQKAIIFLFLVFFFALSSSAHAARKIIISSEKNTLHADEELIINASHSGFLETENIYIKGAFFKDGSSNYFGYTKDEDSWIKNSASSISQRNISIDDWDKSVIVKVDFDDTGFSGVGDYKFKIGYYYINTSGNLSSVKWSENSIPISVAAIPTEIPVVDDSPSNAASESESQDSLSIATATPTNTKKLSTVTPGSDKITSRSKEASEYAKIKPITKEKSEKEESESAVLGVRDSNFPKVLVVFGLAFLAFASYRFIKGELVKRKGL